MKFSRIADIERRVFLYACGISFFLPLSKAAGNIFFALALLGMAHRLALRRDDVAEIFHKYRGIFATVGAFLAAIFISALSSGFVEQGLARFLERYVLHASILLPVVLLRFGRRRIKILAGLLLAGVFVSNSAVVVQALPRLGVEVWRFGGTLTPMTQASLLAMFLPVFVLLFMRFRRWRPIFAVAILVGLAAALFNGTRGAWLTILAMVPVAALMYSKNRLGSAGVLLAGLVLVGAVFVVTPNLSSRLATLTNPSMQSNSERLLMWQSAWRMFEDHPLLGIGYGDYPHAYQTQYISPEAREPNQQHAHNNFLQILAECGILGASAFLAMWVCLSKFALGGWLERKEFACLLFFCVLWGFMLHGLTEYNLETAVTSHVFWYSLGLCLAYCRG